MAGSSGRRDPCPLERGGSASEATAPRSGRRHREDPRKPQIQRPRGKGQDVPRHGIRLSADWTAFRGKVGRPLRDRLYSLIRYCSFRGISPGSVDDQVFDDYWRYRADTTALASNNSARRLTVRAWNACMGAIDA